MTKFYYVYKITNMLNHKIYIGCHSTFDIDDGYMGSGKYINYAINKYGLEYFKKEILAYYTNADDMFAAETVIVNREFIKEDTNYNLAEGGAGGFKGDACYSSPIRSKKISDTQRGKVMAKTVDNDIVKVDISDPRLITKELVGSTTGRAVVKNTDGTIFQVDKNDSRIASGELVGVTKGLSVMKDINGIRYQVSKNDPRIVSGELVGNTRGTTQTSESNKKRSDKLKGIPKPLPYETCQYCGKSTTKTNLIRWHKNCK